MSPVLCVTSPTRTRHSYCCCFNLEISDYLQVFHMTNCHYTPGFTCPQGLAFIPHTDYHIRLYIRLLICAERDKHPCWQRRHSNPGFPIQTLRLFEVLTDPPCDSGFNWSRLKGKRLYMFLWVGASHIACSRKIQLPNKLIFILVSTYGIVQWTRDNRQIAFVFILKM